MALMFKSQQQMVAADGVSRMRLVFNIRRLATE